MRKGRNICFIVFMALFTFACSPDHHYLGHAERPPMRYNHDYISVGEFFDQIGGIAEHDTVMLYGWRKNWCDLQFDVWQYGNHSDCIPLILSNNPKDTLPGRTASSAGCVNISIYDVDTEDYLNNHSTSDLWYVVAVIHFEMCANYEEAFGDCYNEYYSTSINRRI